MAEGLESPLAGYCSRPGQPNPESAHDAAVALNEGPWQAGLSIPEAMAGAIPGALLGGRGRALESVTNAFPLG